MALPSRTNKSGTLRHTGVSSHHRAAHHGHSPFFVIWEIIALACVVFLTFSFIYTQVVRVSGEQLLLIELVDFSAEMILIFEVLLIFLLARNKIYFIKTKWMTILSVLPFGGAFRAVRVLKLGWHAFEKTRAGQFIEHPLRSTKQWIRRRLSI